MPSRRRYSVFTALCVGVAALLSDVPLVDACGKVPLVKLPTAYGLDQCVGNNWLKIVGIAVESTFKCSAISIIQLTKSGPLKKFGALASDLVDAPEKLSATLYEHMSKTGDKEMDAFCKDWSKLVSPCAQALAPKIISLINNDLKCCGQMSDLLDMLNLVVPPNISRESFLLTEIINGVNQLLCTKRSDTKKTCGASIFQQITTKYKKDNFRVLDSFLLPFITASAGDECDAFEGKEYTNSASLKPAIKGIDFSCCASGFRPVLESVQAGFEFVTGGNAIDFLNGVVAFSNSSAKFVNAVKSTDKCKFKATCSAPSGLTNYKTREITPGTNKPKTNELKDTKCKRVKKCDAAGKVCSEICEKGSVVLPSWESQALKYQRKLAYDGPMCYAQIPATHNSAINLAEGFGNRDQLMNANLNPKKAYSYMKTNNHVLSLTDQLNIGVRFLEIDVHYFLGELRTAHCGNLGSNSIEALYGAFKEQLVDYGDIVWTPNLLGCFPSLSGIAAKEQRTFRDAMNEILAWTTKDEPKDELVTIYLDTGGDIGDRKKFPDVDKALKDVFGDLLVPLSDVNAVAAAGWQGSNATLQNFIDSGRRVLVLGNQKTDVAFRLKDFCKGHEVLETKFIDSLPDASRTINGKKIYSSDYFLRSYQSNLRYISLNEGGLISHELPTQLDADHVYNFVRWNLNLVATDGLDAATMRSHIWSWAKDEPRDTSENSTVFIQSDGRWRSNTTGSKTRKACWNASKLKWSIETYDTECGADFSFVAPRDPYQNHLLQQEILAQKLNESVVINVTP
ncbi:hypothetical protein Poli38472_012985 [Pythium oligandrum]|uniref:PLC-like phosphodiesterase n=1 Tax=Pythium oligandrum TaxID=41045 RepID=A0A8K1FN71_PYTOL|nr:hypothetical protein Poli38472_012985 [Pythium oligandrum]|eukprot:TMW64363.1 hypothetical protein Poli38472_012985 [Pythium oligandrum]